MICLGRIQNRLRLNAACREDDLLVVPSLRKTFSLTYIEILSQELPIVHSRRQGVDGFLNPESVAAGVDLTRAASIAEGVADVTSLQPGFPAECRGEARRFFCYIFLSHSALVLVGLESLSPVGLTGALCVWLSVGLSLAGRAYAVVFIFR